VAETCGNLRAVTYSLRETGNCPGFSLKIAHLGIEAHRILARQDAEAGRLEEASRHYRAAARLHSTSRGD